jgi:hypothetical protein
VVGVRFHETSLNHASQGIRFSHCLLGDPVIGLRWRAFRASGLPPGQSEGLVRSDHGLVGDEPEHLLGGGARERSQVPVPRNALAAGAALIVLGVAVTLLSSSDSFTSLIPAVVGVILAGLGLLARSRPAMAHHAMHAAAAVAAISVLASLGSLVGRGGTGSALFSQIATVVICAAFLWLAVQSFRAARQARSTA